MKIGTLPPLCGPGNCDGCGKHRPQLYVCGVNPWDDVIECALCFPCLMTARRDEERQMREQREIDAR